jgi:hypothetical protein
MAYKLTDDAVLLVVRDRDGGLEYHTHGGPQIPWLSPEQRAYLLDHGQVEEVQPTSEQEH